MTNRSDSTQAACSHLTVKYTTEEIGGLTRGWWECKDCKTKFIPAACAPPSSSSGELPKWVRQESCPECDGDGCNFCESRAVAPTPSVFTWSMKACPKEIGAMMNPSADWSISGPNGEWTYFSSDELEKLSKGHLQIIPLERLSELKSTAAPSVSTKPPRPEELLECQNPVYLKLRKIYCCKGAEFCRTELQEAWLEIAKLDWQLNHPAARPSGDGQPALLHKPNDPLPEGCFCQPGKCAAPVIMGRQMPCPDPQKAAGIVRCCENGNFGDGHECRKQPPEPASQPVEGQQAQGAKELAKKILSNCAWRFVHPEGMTWGTPQQVIDKQIELSAEMILAAHPPAEPSAAQLAKARYQVEFDETAASIGTKEGLTDWSMQSTNYKRAQIIQAGKWLAALRSLRIFAPPSGEGDKG